jgi:hypothetical protein
MNLFKNYRIIKIQGNFIAQTRQCFLFNWEGIDRADFYLWFTFDAQIRFCSSDTLEEAKEHLKKYKEFIKKHKEFIKKPKIKYYYDNE